MSEIYVISDTHFGHANILTFTDERGKIFRDFHHVEEMNEKMVENWNRVVTPQDIIYHLGDVYFRDGHKVLPRLNGKKRLILGNHDDGKDPILHQYFQKIMVWRMFPEHNVVMTHIPIYMDGDEHSAVREKVKYNLHGHIHQNRSPTKNHINACVEWNNYTPKRIQDFIPHE